MRSFSNLWYWIGLAVIWSTASHYVLGVPYDMILRARRNSGEAAEDLEGLVRINCNRLLYIGRVTGIWLLIFATALIASLFTLAFWYRVEFAQAAFFLIFPMSIVGGLSLSTAGQIRREGATGELLHKRLGRHRLYTQIIGMLSVFVTAIWGMFHNLSVGVFGNLG